MSFSGVLSNVVNMTIQDGGYLKINEMTALDGSLVDEILFNKIDIKTLGTMEASNGPINARRLVGDLIQVWKYHVLSLKHVYTLIIMY